MVSRGNGEGRRIANHRWTRMNTDDRPGVEVEVAGGTRGGWPGQGISARAVVLATCLAVAAAVITPYTYYLSRTWNFGWGTLPNGPVVLAFLLVAVNGLLVRWRKALGLSRADVVTIYIILTVSAALITVFIPYTVGLTAYPLYQARREVGWEQTILPYVPLWLQPSANESVVWFWSGMPAGAATAWREWVRPVGWWSVLIVAFCGSLLCLGAMLRRDWIERQRLAFPLTEIPMALVGQGESPTVGGSIFTAKAFWLGFVPASGVILLSWLVRLYPALPGFTLEHYPGRIIQSYGLPWSVLWDMKVRLSPAVIGVMSLIPGEIAFSVWAFYVIFNAYLVVCASFGVTPWGTRAGEFNPQAFFDYAEVGGFIVLSAMALYRCRNVVALGFRQLVGLGDGNGRQDPWAPMGSAYAVVGFAVGNAVMLMWALRAGMSWWSFAVEMGILYAILIGVSRLVATAGIVEPMPPVFPRAIMLRLVGARALGPPSLMVAGLLNLSIMREPQNSPLNYLVNGFKLLHEGQVRGRGFAWAVLAPIACVFAAGSAAVIYFSYHHGAVAMICWPITAIPTCAFREFASSLRSAEEPDAWLRGAVVAGAGLTVLLSWLSANFIWWPLHPIGFIIASVWHTNHTIWANALIAWVLTTTIRRFGGFRLYRALRPAFLGLAFGHYLTDAGMALFAALVLGYRGVVGLQ